MSKRNTISAVLLSAAAVAMLCLFSIVSAQKGPEGTASNKPIRGVDVIVKKNPGASAFRIKGTTDSDGKINLGVLAPGTYSLEIIPPSKEKMIALGEGAEYFVVEVSGPSVVGGTQRLAWQVKQQKFVSPSAQSGTARTTTAPAYSEKLQFEITGSPQPVQTTIRKGHSNSINN